MRRHFGPDAVLGGPAGPGGEAAPRPPAVAAVARAATHEEAEPQPLDPADADTMAARLRRKRMRWVAVPPDLDLREAAREFQRVESPACWLASPVYVPSYDATPTSAAAPHPAVFVVAVPEPDNAVAIAEIEALGDDP